MVRDIPVSRSRRSRVSSPNITFSVSPEPPLDGWSSLSSLGFPHTTNASMRARPSTNMQSVPVVKLMRRRLRYFRERKDSAGAA